MGGPETSSKGRDRLFKVLFVRENGKEGIERLKELTKGGSPLGGGFAQ